MKIMVQGASAGIVGALLGAVLGALLASQLNNLMPIIDLQRLNRHRQRRAVKEGADDRH
jgi:ABC-type lipoprotein release transport system permease subunit